MATSRLSEGAPPCSRCGGYLVGDLYVPNERRCVNCGNQIVLDGKVAVIMARPEEDDAPGLEGSVFENSDPVAGFKEVIRKKLGRPKKPNAIQHGPSPGQTLAIKVKSIEKNIKPPGLTPSPEDGKTSPAVRSEPTPDSKPSSLTCPIEEHPLIRFLVHEWEDLEAKIDDLQTPILKLRDDQERLEVLAQRFRDFHLLNPNK